jgi:hypothetical protein
MKLRARLLEVFGVGLLAKAEAGGVDLFSISNFCRARQFVDDSGGE